MVISGNGHKFVVDCHRGVIDAHLPKKVQEQKLQDILEDSQIEKPSCALIRTSDKIHLVAGSADGYALGEIVRANVDGASVLWIDWLDDKSAAVVVINNGLVAIDTIYKVHEDNILIKTAIHEEAYHVLSNGDIPGEIEEYLSTESTRQNTDGRLLHSLAVNDDYYLRSFDTAFEKLHPQSGGGGVIAIAVVIVLAIVGILLLTGGEDEQVEQVDYFADYRQMHKTPSATSSLIEFHRVLDVFTFVEGWVLEECRYTNGHVMCSLSPSPGASTSAIDIAGESLSRNIDYKFIDQFIEVVITGEERGRETDDIITRLDQSTTLLWEEINSSFYPNSISVLETEQYMTWGAKKVVIKKNETIHDTLLILAEQTRGIPVILEGAKVTRSAQALDIEVDLKTFGLM